MNLAVIINKHMHIGKIFLVFTTIVYKRKRFLRPKELENQSMDHALIP